MSRQPGSIQPPYSYSHQHQLSRSAYPTFLSLQETIKLQLTWASRGILKHFGGTVVVKTATSDREIRSNILKSLLLNSLSLTWLHRNVRMVLSRPWLFPVVGISYYLNSSWCNLIAKRSFVLQHGNRAAHQQPVTYHGMLTMLATSAYRVVMILTSVIVSLALGSIPFAGSFVWVARNSSLAQRVRHLEERWAYYFAFGFRPLGLANAALFALMFPAFIIMAMHARPVRRIPTILHPPRSLPTPCDFLRHSFRLGCRSLQSVHSPTVQARKLGDRLPSNGMAPSAGRRKKD
ncbi:EI24-domain-containing protein [Suillus lakei]|nr:EI24-domain-containing protein [Suillus lakei]